MSLSSFSEVPLDCERVRHHREHLKGSQTDLADRINHIGRLTSQELKVFTRRHIQSLEDEKRAYSLKPEEYVILSAAFLRSPCDYFAQIPFHTDICGIEMDMDAVVENILDKNRCMGFEIQFLPNNPQQEAAIIALGDISAGIRSESIKAKRQTLEWYKLFSETRNHIRAAMDDTLSQPASFFLHPISHIDVNPSTGELDRFYQPRIFVWEKQAKVKTVQKIQFVSDGALELFGIPRPEKPYSLINHESFEKAALATRPPIGSLPIFSLGGLSDRILMETEGPFDRLLLDANFESQSETNYRTTLAERPHNGDDLLMECDGSSEHPVESQ